MNAEKGCDLVNAILAINPNAEISQRGPLWKDVEFHDGNPTNITEKQVLEKQQELLQQYEAKQYQRERLNEYPSLNDCIHALLDGGDTLTELQTKRTAIKEKFPKPQ